MSLIEKIRKARESVVEVDGKKFTIRRPTEAEQAEMYKDPKFSYLDLVRCCVVGWDLKEIDLIPGGDPIALTFSQELWIEYVSDHSDLWSDLSNAITESIRAHNTKVERAEKK
jgi:hypothetical protein